MRKQKQGNMAVPTSDNELEKLQRSDHDVLIRLETKMDGLTTEMRQSSSTTTAVATDHEARIRVLEKRAESTTGERDGSIRTRNTIIAVMGLVLTALSIYVIYSTGH